MALTLTALHQSSQQLFLECVINQIFNLLILSAQEHPALISWNISIANTLVNTLSGFELAFIRIVSVDTVHCFQCLIAVWGLINVLYWCQYDHINKSNGNNRNEDYLSDKVNQHCTEYHWSGNT